MALVFDFITNLTNSSGSEMECNYWYSKLIYLSRR